jgi:hypothetical protein
MLKQQTIEKIYEQALRYTLPLSAKRLIKCDNTPNLGSRSIADIALEP